MYYLREGSHLAPHSRETSINTILNDGRIDALVMLNPNSTTRFDRSKYHLRNRRFLRDFDDMGSFGGKETKEHISFY